MESLNELFDKNEDVDVKRKIVEQLLTEENLESKTELIKPLRWSCLDSIRDFIEKHKMSYSQKILDKFINALSNLSEAPKQISPLNPMGVK
jgi:hypothetical protein